MYTRGVKRGKVIRAEAEGHQVGTELRPGDAEDDITSSIMYCTRYSICPLMYSTLVNASLGINSPVTSLVNILSTVNPDRF